MGGPGPQHIVRKLELAQRRIERDLASIAVSSGQYSHLTHAQSRLLEMIPPQGITATQLSTHARITKQGLGQMVDVLEDRGMVRRRPDPHDGRARLIVRTAKGNATVDAITDWMLVLHERLSEVLGAERFDVLLDALGTLGHGELDPYTDPALNRSPMSPEDSDNT